MSTVTVTGAGGFIGGHLVNQLVGEHNTVLAVDIKPLDEWHQVNADAHNIPRSDLRDYKNTEHTCFGVDAVYNLAADMGGMGFIENNKAACMQSVLISTNMLRAAWLAGVPNYFYSSSACVYAGDKQTETSVTALKESDAYPADPEDGYGWEKLFSERMANHFREDYGMRTRVARYHNVYGTHGTFEGGREKAPAAICRKVIEAQLSGKYEIDIWGDGEQTRSFMYIDDCLKGTRAIMDSGIEYPINLGSNELVTINQLVDIMENIADVTLDRTYDLSAPQGVRGRNSDNTLIKAELGWEPSIPLKDGMAALYEWMFPLVEGQFAVSN